MKRITEDEASLVRSVAAVVQHGAPLETAIISALQGIKDSERRARLQNLIRQEVLKKISSKGIS